MVPLAQRGGKNSFVTCCNWVTADGSIAWFGYLGSMWAIGSVTGPLSKSMPLVRAHIVDVQPQTSLHTQIGEHVPILTVHLAELDYDFECIKKCEILQEPYSYTE